MLCKVISELEDCLNKNTHIKFIAKIEYVKDDSYFESTGFMSVVIIGSDKFYDCIFYIMISHRHY